MDDSQLFGTMKTFIAVVECGSFSACARTLGVSQPSVSRQINQLESKLGVRLLQRTTRRLSLTEAGELYYQKARKIQHDVIEANESLRDLRETPAGLLRISLPHTWADTRVAPYLDEFLQLYPEINLQIECNDSIQDIVEDRLDLVIRVGQVEDSSYVSVPFGTLRLVLCASPGYIHKHGTITHTEQIQSHNFIIYENYDHICFTQRNTQSIHVRHNVSTNNVNVIISCLLQDMGLSVLPDLLIHKLLATGKLVDLMPGVDISVPGLPVEGAYALYSNRRQLPVKVRAFIDFFRPRFSTDSSLLSNSPHPVTPE